MTHPGPHVTWVLGYLLNSLWQVPLIFVAAWLAARALRAHGAATVHRVWVCALLLESVVPACPAEPMRWFSGVLALIGRSDAGRAGEVSVVMGAGSGGVSLPFQLPAILVPIYAFVIVYFAARLLWACWNTRAIRRRSHPLVLTGEPAAHWRRCSDAFRVHDARIATCEGILGPMTVGVRRRLVLLPVGMTDRLADEELRVVIAHEFAHMRRRDFTWNLLYELLSVPVDYHPALWLTRARLVESREMVCDGIAAEAVAGRERYARSLLRLASLFLPQTAAVASHAIGIFDANTFERRIMKLTDDRKELRGTRRVAILAACVAGGLGTCVSAVELRANVALPNADKTAVASADGKKSITVPAGEMAGHVHSKVTPVYPKAAKEAKIEGQVVLHAVIGKDGTIENLQVVSGPKELTGSSLDAVRQWTYDPYLLNGEPTEVETTITVTYTLAR